VQALPCLEMKNDYADIRDKISAAPSWWDEHGVPRYCVFTPLESADIYATACILLEIECQGCATPFKVCMSESQMSLYKGALLGLAISKEEINEESVKAEIASSRLENRVPRGAIHYGDPPNADCCPAGSVMNSIPVRVLEFWRQERQERDGKKGWPEWTRVPALEVEIATPDWLRDDEDETQPQSTAPAA
jgi:hypothetical protein